MNSKHCYLDNRLFFLLWSSSMLLLEFHCPGTGMSNWSPTPLIQEISIPRSFSWLVDTVCRELDGYLESTAACHSPSQRQQMGEPWEAQHVPMEWIPQWSLVLFHAILFWANVHATNLSYVHLRPPGIWSPSVCQWGTSWEKVLTGRRSRSREGWGWWGWGVCTCSFKQHGLWWKLASIIFSVYYWRGLLVN